MLLLAVAAARCTSPTTATTTTTTLSGLTLSSGSVTGATVVTGTVSLSVAAPTGGVAVTLTSSNSAVTVPSAITVPAGSTTQSFGVSTTNTSAVATITATYSGASQTATLTVTAQIALALQGLVLSNNVANAGQSLQGIVTLTAPAPVGGVAVSLTSSNPLVTVPPTVTVPLGNISQPFEIDTGGASSGTATISASWNGTVQRATLTIGGLALSFGATTSVLGGSSTVLIVNLAAPAPDGGAAVSLTSNSSLLQVPSTVTIPSGTAAQAVPISTSSTASTTTANVTATYNGASAVASLTVFAYPNVTALTCAPSTINGGDTVSCSGTLASGAPAGGWRLLLASDNTAATVPSSVVVSAGASTFSFTIATTAVPATAVAAIQIFDAASGAIVWRELITIH